MSSSKKLLVIDGNALHNWVELFEHRTLADGTPIEVVQASWNELSVVVYGDSGCMVTAAPIHESTGQTKRPHTMTFKPDFVLVRNQPRGPTPATDRRNVLFGLMVANVPSINSLESLYLDLERSSMVGQLKAVEKRLGHENFPLVPITYYDYPERMVIFDKFPCVCKVSHAHAGMGKQKLMDTTAFRDISTVLSLHQDYCTVEPFIECDYGVRIQKIGNHYRVYKKVFTGSGWKSQFGGADLQHMELTDKFKLWADECATCYGGMDLLAIDVLVDKQGGYHILELNGTAIGIQVQYWKEDSACLVDLVLDRMANPILSHLVPSGAKASDASETVDVWRRQHQLREMQLEKLRQMKNKAKRDKLKNESEVYRTLVQTSVSALVLGLAMGTGVTALWLGWH